MIREPALAQGWEGSVQEEAQCPWGLRAGQPRRALPTYLTGGPASPFSPLPPLPGAGIYSTPCLQVGSLPSPSSPPNPCLEWWPLFPGLSPPPLHTAVTSPGDAQCHCLDQAPASPGSCEPACPGHLWAASGPVFMAVTGRERGPLPLLQQQLLPQVPDASTERNHLLKTWRGGISLRPEPSLDRQRPARSEVQASRSAAACGDTGWGCAGQCCEHQRGPLWAQGPGAWHRSGTHSGCPWEAQQPW